jgi:hypothetical protein
LDERTSRRAMPDTDGSQSTVMARLTLSALASASHDPACWSDPLVHRALLVSGLSVLTAGTRLLQDDLDGDDF